MRAPGASSTSSSSLANGPVVYSGPGAEDEDARRDGHDTGTGGAEAGGELLLRFREACKRADGLQAELNNPQKLALYGLFKQATDPNGRNPTAPSRLSLIERAKWEAWYEVRHVSATARQPRASLSSLSDAALPRPGRTKLANFVHHQHVGARLEPTACADCVYRDGRGVSAVTTGRRRS